MITQAQKKLAIDKIASANDGVATPDAVVQEAKNPKHILNQCFNWDDASAAHEQRLDTARKLIASVQVIVEYEDICFSAVSYVHDVRRGRKEQGYVSVDMLRKRREDAQQTILLELERIVGAIERTRSIAGSLGLATFFEAMLLQATQAKIRIEKKKRTT